MAQPREIDVLFDKEKRRENANIPRMLIPILSSLEVDCREFQRVAEALGFDVNDPWADFLESYWPITRGEELKGSNQVKEMIAARQGAMYFDGLGKPPQYAGVKPGGVTIAGPNGNGVTGPQPVQVIVQQQEPPKENLGARLKRKYGI